jgi:hypothetical protein
VAPIMRASLTGTSFRQSPGFFSPAVLVFGCLYSPQKRYEGIRIGKDGKTQPPKAAAQPLS